MSDADLARFLGIDADHPNLPAFMAGLDPGKRASYERMHQLCGELELWQAGFGPKPTGVLIDTEEAPMTKGPKKKAPIPLDQPASCVLMDYGGHSVWMTPEAAKDFAARLRKRSHRCYIVRRKVKP